MEILGVCETNKKCMTLHTMMTTKVMCVPVGVDVHVLFSKCQGSKLAGLYTY